MSPEVRVSRSDLRPHACLAWAPGPDFCVEDGAAELQCPVPPTSRRHGRVRSGSLLGATGRPRGREAADGSSASDGGERPEPVDEPVARTSLPWPSWGRAQRSFASKVWFQMVV